LTPSGRKERENKLSADFKRMIELLLQQKPEINAEQVRDMIDEKKRRVGAGYLTDQGALFLVAADLGVSFDHTPKLQSGLKDLYIGAKEVTAVGRIMNIYPVRKFTRKETGEQSATRTLTIYDKDARVKVRLWDDYVNVPDRMNLRQGDIIKISKGYVKAGLDGKPVINLGSFSTVEVARDDGSIPPIDSITITVDDVKSPLENAVVKGVVNSNPRVSDFTNQRGELCKSLQLQISNDANTRTLRAVIWNIEPDRIPKVFNPGSKVRLVGVRIKQGSEQYGNGDFEIHGDEGTLLEFDSQQQEIDVMPLRIISVGEETGRGSINCLAVDRSGRTFALTIDNELLAGEKASAGTIIECVPSRIFGTSMILSKEDSYVRIVDEDQSFPGLSKFESKIKDIQPSQNPYIVEAIVLQAPDSTDINTKTGELVSVSSTLLGDDTGEIKLVGWRTQSTPVSRLTVGDRIKVIGAYATAGRDNGRSELTLKSHSSIIKIS